jgi:hypothetical protein
VAETNPRVMEMVAKELEKDPAVRASTLRKKALEIDKSIGDLSVRQFHARYPLPLKRKRTAGKKPSGRRAAPSAARRARGSAKPEGSPRDRVRRIILDFAGDLARAESRASIVEVLGKVDEYVDRVMRTTGR